MTLLAGTFLFAGSVMAQTNVSGTVTSGDDGWKVQTRVPSPTWTVTSSSTPPPVLSWLSPTWA